MGRVLHLPNFQKDYFLLFFFADRSKSLEMIKNNAIAAPKTAPDFSSNFTLLCAYAITPELLMNKINANIVTI